VEEVCDVFSISENTLFQIIQHLLDRQVVSVTQKENEEGKREEYYSLAPLFQQLEILHRQEVAKKEENDNPNLIFVIEKEFGRPISSYEIQMIKSWIDKDEYSYELILAALKEAVLNQVFTLKYMYKIFLTWQRKGCKTVQQVIQDKNRSRNGHFTATTKDTTPIPQVPLDNWLD
ncbi:MAG: DnaD domain protein, partial [Granulicatella sp.]|nr:DnaD domain protein [Granulicatella sp.]